MKIAPLADVKAKFSSYIELCQKEPVVVTKNGYVQAVLIPATDDDMERLSLAFNPEFRKIIKDARKDLKKHGGIPHDEFWKKLETQ